MEELIKNPILVIIIFFFVGFLTGIICSLVEFSVLWDTKIEKSISKKRFVRNVSLMIIAIIFISYSSILLLEIPFLLGAFAGLFYFKLKVLPKITSGEEISSKA